MAEQGRREILERVLGPMFRDPRSYALLALMLACLGFGSMGNPIVEPKAYVLNGNEILKIELPANPSTGYGWEVARGDTEDFLQMAGENFEPGSDLLGAPGVQTLYFLAKAKGMTTLRLIYRRPWEDDVEPADSFSLEIEIADPFIGNHTPPIPVDTIFDEGPYLADDEVTTLPKSFNWCKKEKCTPIKNQRACGSCWAFATVAVFESHELMKSGELKDLSEQYLVSCNRNGWGCQGGWFAHAYHWNKIGRDRNKPGARYESQFGYRAANVRCIRLETEMKLRGWSYVRGTPNGVPSVTALKKTIKEHGPIAVAVCANTAFRYYKSGVFRGPECSNVNHAVVLVGWNDHKQAWLLRNSWGEGWGINGYMWIGWGVSKVGRAANYVLY